MLEVPCRWDEHNGAFKAAVIDDGVSNLKLSWWPGTDVLQLVGDPEQRLQLIRS